METLSQNMVLFLLILVLWVLPWKGYAVWTAAQKRNKRWFIVLLILNTFAILDIIYIFYVAKKTPKDIVRVFKTKI